MILTQRLALRRFRVEDGAALYAYLSREDVVLYEPYGVQSRADCDEEAARRADNPDFLAICLREDGRMIGNIYLSRREYQTFELGYVIHPEYGGKGYATEAARAAVDHAFREREARRVQAHCNPRNHRSWKLMERLSMRREGHLRGNVFFRRDERGNPLWQDTYVYAILAGEWLAENAEKSYGRPP